MRDDYALKGPTTKVEIEVEKPVSEQLILMEKFTKIPRSEIVNTALKRFITQHKDFFPPDYKDR